MPHTGTVLARFPRFLLRQAEALGLDRSRLVEASSLTPRELEDPDARVLTGKTLALWRAIESESDDAGLGVLIGSAMSARQAGLVGYTMMHSPSLGEALQRLIRFGRILDESFPSRMEIRGGRLEFDIEPLPEQKLTLRRMADFDLAAHLAVMREITGLDLLPLEVHFPYREPPRDLSAHRDFFRSRLLFDRPRTGLVLEAGHSELPVRTADAALGRYLDQLAEEVLKTLAPRRSVAERVERALWADIKEGRPQLERVASAVAMSPRTLQRRLRGEGVTFAALLDRFRRRMAAALLEDRDLAIYEIAFLGYSEPSTFYRAFRRWTGTSPREFRASSGP